ncbi:unnamed protein product, partial [Musa textilis]
GPRLQLACYASPRVGLVFDLSSCAHGNRDQIGPALPISPDFATGKIRPMIKKLMCFYMLQCCMFKNIDKILHISMLQDFIMSWLDDLCRWFFWMLLLCKPGPWSEYDTYGREKANLVS